MESQSCLLVSTSHGSYSKARQAFRLGLLIDEIGMIDMTSGGRKDSMTGYDSRGRMHRYAMLSHADLRHLLKEANGIWLGIYFKRSVAVYHPTATHLAFYIMGLPRMPSEREIALDSQSSCMLLQRHWNESWVTESKFVHIALRSAQF